MEASNKDAPAASTPETRGAGTATATASATAATGFKKKPKLTKKERRELQEKQRAEKQQRKDAGQGRAKTAKTRSNVDQRKGFTNSGVSLKQRSKEQMVKRTPTQKQVALFSHLPQYERESSLSLNVGFSERDAIKIHPSILALGLKYGDNIINGANARAVAMLLSFREFIADYQTPPGQALARDLDKQLKPLIQFLTDCRPHSITMGNAIKHVRHAIANIPPEMNEVDAKKRLFNVVDNFIQSSVTMAQEEIVKFAQLKIVHGDVILTFARSHVIEKLLLHCHEVRKTSFKVILVSARTRNDESKEMVQLLAQAGVDCTFVALSSISYVMSRATKVFLGAGALFSNGTVLGMAGTAAVAMVARAFNKPVLFCAETYKFTERVQLDSITNNELGDPDDLILPSELDGDKTTRSALSDWRDIPSMKLLNLIYDLTAMEHVTMVITEVGMIPASSVPVIVREQSEAAENLYMY